MEFDFVSALVDEVALEGLDGITISSLWVRLQHRPGFGISLDEQSKTFLWRVLCQQVCLEMYVLPEPRPVIHVISRQESMDINTEPDSVQDLSPFDPYVVKVVNKDGIQGSCATYDLRENVTNVVHSEELSLGDVINRWGDRFVIVADQATRTQTLLGQTSDPNQEISTLTYCILEKVGRSRYEGELPGTKAFTEAFKEHKLTSKDVHYHRKFLYNVGLIKKQLFVTKKKNQSMNRSIMVHLPRFYRLWKTLFQVLLTKICEHLQTCPNNSCERKVCKEYLGNPVISFKRFLTFGAPYIKSCKLKYAELYPDSAEEDQYYINGSEKLVDAIIMIKKFPPDHDDEDKSDPEDEDEEGELTHTNLKQTATLTNERLLNQKVYKVIESAGAEGVTRKEIELILGITSLDSRGAIKALAKSGIVADPVIKDKGRQKIGVYVASYHLEDNQINLEIKKEKTKLQRLFQKSPEKKPSGNDDPPQEDPSKDAELLQDILPDTSLDSSTISQVTNIPDSPHTIRVNDDLCNSTVHLSNLNLKRMNIILEAVREAKLIENCFTLKKLIMQKEENDPDRGGIVDRRSILRIISLLTKAGQLRTIKTTISSLTHTRELHFICDASLMPDDPLVQSAIEHARLKYFTVNKEVCRVKKAEHDNAKFQTPEQKKSLKRSYMTWKNFQSYAETEDMVYDPTASAKYGFAHKFKRMGLLHRLLWYHVYGYQGTPPPSMASQGQYLGFTRLTTAEKSKPKKGKGQGKRTRVKKVNKDDSDLDHHDDLICSDKETDKPVEDNETEPMQVDEQPEKALSSDRINVNTNNEYCSEITDAADKDATGLAINDRVNSTSLTEVDKTVSLEGKDSSNLDDPKSIEEGQADVTKTSRTDTSETSEDDKGKTKANLDGIVDPPVYLDELSWKRYLPPLTKHKDYPEGWCLVSDVLLSLPLTLFCQMISIPYQVSGLLDLLQDPVKQNLPLIALPPDMSKQLLYARKYVFSVHAILNQLCQIGLLSFGQQQHKEKGQVFVYIHKRASLLNTTTSLPGYMLTRTPDDKPFSRVNFTFNTFQDVEEFWSEFMGICLATNLNRQVDFKATHSAVVEPLPPGHVSITDILKPVTPDTVKDEGFIPGDGRGAAGLDSSLFCHLYRNWSTSKVPISNWHNKPFNLESRAKKLSAIKRKKSKGENSGITFDESSAHTRLPRLVPNQKLTLGETNKGNKEKQVETIKSQMVKGTRGNRGGKGIKRKPAPGVEKLPRKSQKSVAKGRVWAKKRIRKKDARDLLAENQMKKRRVEWSPKEDSLLLLSTVANLFLSGGRNRRLVPWSVVRDVMQESFEVSRDKTSRSCQRRVLFVLKNPQTVLNVETFLAETQHDKTLMSEFPNQNYKSTDPIVKEEFKSLLKKLREKFLSGDYVECMPLPPTLKDLHCKYTVTVVGNWRTKRLFQEVHNTDDIHESVLRDIIHSFMSISDKKGRCQEIYLLFNQYNDHLLSKVFSNMREDKIITRLKKELKTKVLRSRQISPLHAHHLSQGYFNQLLCRIPQDVFEKSWSLYSELVQASKTVGGNPYVQIPSTYGGHSAVVVDMMAAKKLNFTLTVPDQILVLDKHAVEKEKPKKHKVDLKYLEQKKRDREEDEDIERFEKTHPKILSRENSTSRSKTRSSVQTEAIDQQLTFQRGAVTVILSEPTTAANSDSASTTTTVSMDTEPLPSVDSDNPGKQCAIPPGIASRFTLSMLRNQCIDTAGISMIHPSDHFLINVCDVKAMLKIPPPNEAKENQESEKLSQDILTNEHMSKVVRSLLNYHPLSLSEKDELENISSNLSTPDFSLCQLLYQAVNEATFLGISFADLMKVEGLSCVKIEHLSWLIRTLRNHHLVLRVGVISHKYVSHVYSKPWLPNGYKDVRGRSKPSSLIVEDDSPTNQAGTNSVFPITREATLSTNPGELFTHTQDETVQKKDIPMTEGSKVEEFERSSERYKSTYEKVLFLPRPWRKPEGWLNRDLLLTLLKGISSYILMKPGSELQTIIDKFTPILQPVSTIELLEVLEDLGIVRPLSMKKSPKPSLFSTRYKSTVKTEKSIVSSADIAVMYETTIHAIQRVGQFSEYIRKQQKLDKGLHS